MIYGNQILCKSDFKMNFEQFIKWIKFKTDLWTFIQINILNDFDFHISLSDFSIKRTNKYVLESQSNYANSQLWVFKI